MTKNPFINAISASAYIILVVGIINFISEHLKNEPDTFLAPILALSLLTLSVTVMAYLFFYQPLILFIAGKKKAALELFTRTVGVFAIITALVLGLIFLPVF